jgi:hypothetical protein
MISENLIGEVRKYRAFDAEWQYEVVDVATTGQVAKVKISKGNGETVRIVTWTAGELADHGFEI